MIAWKSKFLYGVVGSQVQWQTLLPVRPWDREMGGVGGARRSATGVLAAYTVRDDHLLYISVRFFEHEWAAFQQLLSWGRSGEPFYWYPDPVAAPGVFFIVDLESPKAGEKYKPTRSTQYARAHELTIVIRRIDNQVWDLEWIAGGAQLAWGQ